jgi:hypothetical protein
VVVVAGVHERHDDRRVDDDHRSPKPDWARFSSVCDARSPVDDFQWAWPSENSESVSGLGGAGAGAVRPWGALASHGAFAGRRGAT